MNDVVDFYFSLLGSSWALIVSHWILSFGILLLILGLVIDLIKDSIRR